MSDTGGSRPASDRPELAPNPVTQAITGVVTGTTPPVEATSGASGIANAVGAPAAQQAQAVPPDPTYGRWGKDLVEAILATIRKRESGGNYKAKNKNSSASGAYQYIDGTWGGYGGFAHASDAPPEIQDRKAREDVIRILDTHNGDVTAVPQIWYYPAGYGKPDLKPPGANTLTMGQYTSAWMATFNDVTAGKVQVPGGAAANGAPAAGGGVAATAATPGATTMQVGGTSVTVGPARPTLPPNATPQQVDQYIRDYFGAMAWMLDIPELSAVIRQAASAGWDDTRLQAALAQTHWYQTHNTDARQFEVLRNTDPQQAEQVVRDRVGTLIDDARRQGINLTPERARDIALNGLTAGWGPTEWEQAVLNEYHYDQANLRGQAQAYDEQYRQLASDYGIPISDAVLGWWVESTIKGTGDPGAVENYLRQQAKSLYPWMAELIDAGMTPRQYADPYINSAAQLLERNPSDFTLSDRLVKTALQGQPDEKGTRRPMGLAEFEDFVRGQPEWDATKQARAQGADMVGFLGQAFGAAA